MLGLKKIMICPSERNKPTQPGMSWEPKGSQTPPKDRGCGKMGMQPGDVPGAAGWAALCPLGFYGIEANRNLLLWGGGIALE